MKPLYVRNVMTPIENCAVVKLTDTIRDLKQVLCEKGHRVGIVVNDNSGKVAGVITVTDLEFVGEEEPIDPHCKKPAYTISPDVLISFARQELRTLFEKHKKRIHQLVVVDKDNLPLGIIWDHAAILGCPDTYEKKS